MNHWKLTMVIYKLRSHALGIWNLQNSHSITIEIILQSLISLWWFLRCESFSFLTGELYFDLILFQRKLEGHAGDVNTCQFYPSGLVVLSGGLDTQLKIWSVEDGSCPRTLRGHEGGNWQHADCYSSLSYYSEIGHRLFTNALQCS